MMVRLHNDLLARLRDASGRYRLSVAEIARRACRRYIAVGRVSALRIPQTATRANSTPIQLRDLPEIFDGPPLAAVLDWYLREYDKGAAVSGPSMSGCIRPLAGGGIAYCGPVDEETEAEVNHA